MVPTVLVAATVTGSSLMPALAVPGFRSLHLLRALPSPCALPPRRSLFLGRSTPMLSPPAPTLGRRRGAMMMMATASDPLPPEVQGQVEELGEVLRGLASKPGGKKGRVLFITGAGMSADSGLPTYRGIGGLYDSGVTEDGFAIEDAISGPMLETRPAMAWKYLAQIEESCRGAAANDGHRAIKEFEKYFDTWVLTQNIDGFHHDAGSTNIIAIHGDLHKLECTGCGKRQVVKDYSEMPYLRKGQSDLEVFPRCGTCEELVRPGVVLFGENLYDREISTLQEQLGMGFDVVLSVGTTSTFPYIVAPVTISRSLGKTTVEINPGETVVSNMVDYRIKHRAKDVLTVLVKRMEA